MNRIAVVALTATLLACASTRAERGNAQPGAQTQSPAGPDEKVATAPGATSRPADGAGMAAICPMDVPGTSVTSADTAEGEALTFTTTNAGQVDELRRRVRALADVHNQHMAAAANGSPTSAPAGGTGSGGADAGHRHGMTPQASRATVSDVENGARVSIAALDPAQADQLRAMARMHATHLQQNGCGMMHGGEPHQ